MICLALLICETWELCDAASGFCGKWAAQKHIRAISLSPTVHTAAALSKHVQTHTDAIALTKHYDQTYAHLWKQACVFGCMYHQLFVQKIANYLQVEVQQSFLFQASPMLC